MSIVQKFWTTQTDGLILIKTRIGLSDLIQFPIPLFPFWTTNFKDLIQSYNQNVFRGTKLDGDREHREESGLLVRVWQKVDNSSESLETGTLVETWRMESEGAV